MRGIESEAASPGRWSARRGARPAPNPFLEGQRGVVGTASGAE